MKEKKRSTIPPLHTMMGDAVQHGYLATFERAAENYGEQMAREAWADAQFRAEMQALMRAWIKQVWADLSTSRRRNGTKKRRTR